MVDTKYSEKNYMVENKIIQIIFDNLKKYITNENIKFYCSNGNLKYIFNIDS